MAVALSRLHTYIPSPKGLTTPNMGKDSQAGHIDALDKGPDSVKMVSGKRLL